MLQDLVRTGTYQQAFLQNKIDFKDKIVLDVGTGTGILSFFAAQAGARKVYAVEASQSHEVAKLLSVHNGFDHIVEVIHGKLEDITLPEKVDIIISEPIGFLLVHERMLESYVQARIKFLKPDGLMMPTTGSIIFSPITDEVVHREQQAKGALWQVEQSLLSKLLFGRANFFHK
jgi:type I protein arginine methyltransferase